MISRGVYVAMAAMSRGPMVRVVFAGVLSYMYDLYDMGPAMLSVRLPEELEQRLEALAKATGRSKTYYVREALIQKLEDMEDLYLAEAVLERIASGEEKVISAEEFWREMDD